MRTTKILALALLLVSVLSCSNNAGPAKGGTTVDLTKSEFQSKVFDFEKSSEWNYQGDVPCVIDFYATWCGPCRMMSPLVEEIARKYDGKIIVYKVDTDKEQLLAQTLGISSLPTLLFIPAKGQPQSSIGAIPNESLEKAVKEILLVK